MLRRAVACALVAAMLTGCGDAGVTDEQAADAIIQGSNARLRSTLRSMRGRPVVVNYWATWCIPCKDEMPRIAAAARKYSGRVHFLGVNVQDDTQAAARFVRKNKVPFRSLSDARGAIRRDQKIFGLPVTQFYAADGELAFIKHAEISKAELEDKIREVLALD